mmetsp:Transcript_6949/g.5206  ORF Transcript_6949/g.5206 Transcript_6949/m.5206 type:complete len:103 (-) Transcript_6949:34-342(-)
MLLVEDQSFTVSRMGCYGGKYFESLNSTNIYNLKCSDQKEQVARMWEPDLGKLVQDQLFTYSCLNLGCKGVFGTWLELKLEYLALAGFGLVFINSVLAWLSY